ncbi:MAG: SDR family oxidoreductase [Deltaproteobacteria bacterium]
MKNVFVTGTSSGFGKLTAEALVRGGHNVFATMRDPYGRNTEAAEALRQLDGPGRLHVIACDVTDDIAVEKAVREAMEAEGHIDVVVNNAGAGSMGMTEAFTPEAMQALFDLNVFGPHRVNRWALRAMRDRAQGGLLIHVSSTLGRMVFPYCGVYTASKFALEGLAETMRYELAPLGIDSVIVEPGGYATDFFGSMRKADDAQCLATLGDAKQAPVDFWGQVAQGLASDDAPSPTLVADAIVELVEMEGPRPLRTVVDPNLGAGPDKHNGAQAELQRSMFEALQIADRLAGPKSQLR